jgi:predicted transcriptional regulator
VLRDPDTLGGDVAAAMGPPLPAVDDGESLREVYEEIAGGGAAVLVVRGGRPSAVITRSDLLEYLARAPGALAP